MVYYEDISLGFAPLPPNPPVYTTDAVCDMSQPTPVYTPAITRCEPDQIPEFVSVAKQRQAAYVAHRARVHAAWHQANDEDFCVRHNLDPRNHKSLGSPERALP